MTHDSAVVLLPEYLEGRLGERERVAVAAHCVACDECRDLTDTYGAIAASLRGRAAAASEDHPTSDRIVAFAIGPGNLETEVSAAIVAHLRGCPDCAREVETTRQADERTRARFRLVPGTRLVRMWGGWSPNFRAALAAMIVLVVLGYPAYLGLTRLPWTAEELREATRWSGPIDLIVLDSAERGDGPLDTLTIASGQPYVLVGVLPPLPAAAAGVDRFRFTIEPGPGEVIWAAEVTASEIRTRLDSSGVISFPVPAAILRPGRYELVFSRPDTPRVEALLQVPFEVIRVD
jgi:hypothetical protein